MLPVVNCGLPGVTHSNRNRMGGMTGQLLLVGNDKGGTIAAFWLDGVYVNLL